MLGVEEAQEALRVLEGAEELVERDQLHSTRNNVSMRQRYMLDTYELKAVVVAHQEVEEGVPAAMRTPGEQQEEEEAH